MVMKKKRSALGGHVERFTSERADPKVEKGIVVKGPRTLPLDRHPVAVYLGRLPSKESKRAMEQSVELVAATLSGGKESAYTLDWSTIRYQHAARLRAMLLEGKALAWVPERLAKNGNEDSPPDFRVVKGRRYCLSRRQLGANAVNRALAALRGVLGEAWNLKLMSAEDYHRAINFKQVKINTVRKGRLVPEGELRAMFRACLEDKDDCAVRDRGILALVFGCGLRRSEIVGLDIEDYDSANETLVVRGKGSKERLAHVKNGTKTALEDWLEIRGKEPGPLFWTSGKDRRLLPGGRLTDQAIYWLAARRAREAKIPSLSPHDGRRTFISTALDVVGDLSLVAGLVGHSRTDTTRGYDLRDERARAKAAGEIFIPVDG